MDDKNDKVILVIANLDQLDIDYWVISVLYKIIEDNTCFEIIENVKVK